MSEAKKHPYCVDCRFFDSAHGVAMGSCFNPKAPVTVMRFISPQYDARPMAAQMRGEENRCGPSGKWFEEKGGLHG
jgi:hypothetical protein